MNTETGVEEILSEATGLADEIKEVYTNTENVEKEAGLAVDSMEQKQVAVDNSLSLHTYERNDTHIYVIND